MPMRWQRIFRAAGLTVGIVGMIDSLFLGPGVEPVYLTIFATLLGVVVFADERNPNEEPPEYDPPEEPVDVCDHTAKCEPVMADVTGDLVEEVVAWLCTEDDCHAKVSPREAMRRNNRPFVEGIVTRGSYMWDPPLRATDRTTPLRMQALREELVHWGREVQRISDGFDDAEGRGHFTVSIEQHAQYQQALDAATAVRDSIIEEEGRIADRIAAGIECEGYVELRETGGSVTRHYARPGECLCGECPDPPPTTPVLAYGSEVPVRRLAESPGS